MSVLIPGMEMPQRCSECCMYDVLGYHDNPLRPDEVCRLECRQLPEDEEIPSWCPLVEIKTPTWSLLDALDGVTWYNGLAEEVFGWTFLPTEGQEDRKIITFPRSVNPMNPDGQQLEVIWMIAVILFGDYGMSPRTGWIEDIEGFREFCQDITMTWKDKKEVGRFD